LSNKSNEKATELILAMFGTSEEVHEMAMPIRTAENRKEATTILRQIAGKDTVLSSKMGISARFPTHGIGKLVSSMAVHTSFNEKAHYLAVVNVDKLFAHAIEPWKFEVNPEKNNQDLKERHYLYALMYFEERIITVKFTVKEYIDERVGTKLYSIEAVDAEVKN
jgi:hypothetical protein